MFFDAKWEFKIPTLQKKDYVISLLYSDDVLWINCKTE